MKQQEVQHRRRHGFDPSALLTGLVLIALAAAFLLAASDAWHLPRRWSLPLGAGGLALAAIGALAGRAVRGQGRGRRSEPPAAAPGPGDEGVDGQ